MPSDRLHRDDAGQWPQAEWLVQEDIRQISDDGAQVIGIVTLTCPSKPEVAQLDGLRDDTAGRLWRSSSSFPRPAARVPSARCSTGRYSWTAWSGRCCDAAGS